MAGKKPGRMPSARARGLRTLQHQTLSPAVRHAIDTEVWLRGLLLAREPGLGVDARWATKDQVHDEALGWFLQQHAQQPVQDYPARRTGDEDLTFWLDSRIMERARRMAARDGVKVARLIDAALSAYVRQQVPRELVEFRQRVQGEALKLYGQHRGALPAPLRARKAGP
ncbi:MAG TPA: hypothetical protein VGP20_01630 [Steroidobacteraceae bacterium]|jgi:hypothetical protein|nr:hypothetical protein [Steroidobacteraceae bacterium]